MYTCAFARFGDNILGLRILVVEKSITANQLTCILWTREWDLGCGEVVMVAKGSLTFNCM